MDERERQYREYMALREHKHSEHQHEESPNHEEPEFRYNAGDVNKTKHRRISVTNTPYGASELRKKQKEKERRDREMHEYLAMRDGHQQNHDAKKKRKTKTSGITRIAKNGHFVESKHVKKGPARQRKKSNKKLRVAVIVLLVFVIGFALTVGGGIVMALTALGSMQNAKVDKGNIGINSTVEQQLDGYRNIAVLGIDARANEDDSQCRSDSIIVTSINKETNEVKMFSVYRDTMLDVGDQGLDKITHAYFYGGAEQSLYALNKNLDLNIDEIVVINWKTVADVIDAVGGIEINIKDSEIEEMNKYIPNTAKNVNGPKDKIKTSGKQTLNGVQAVTYSRIRKDALTGDYRRNERMKAVFSKTFKKVKNSGFLTMFGVARHALPEIKTNMGAGDILGMMIKFKSFDMTDSTTGFPYDVSSWTGYGGAGYAWYGPPINLANNVSKLHEQFFDQKDYSPTDTVYEISNNISYKTGIY